MDSNLTELKTLPSFGSNDNAEISDRTRLLGDDQYSNRINGCDDNETKDRRLTIDEIAESFQCGLFQYLCCAISGLCFTSETLLIQSSSIIVVSACDLNINSKNRVWLGTTMALGIAVSNIFWGRLGDFVGRRRIIMISLSINIIFTLMSAFSYSYSMLIGMAFCNGLGSGGVLPVTLAYAIEFFPRKYRGIASSISNACWCLGSLYVSLMAYWIIPQSFKIVVGSITLVSWRVFVIVSIIPPLLALIGLSQLPNSPRFLIKRGKGEKTLKALAIIHNVNNNRCCYKDDKESLSITLSNLPTKEDIDSDMNESYGKGINSSNSPLLKAFRQYVVLYSARWRKRSILLPIIWFLYCFATFAIWLWLPTLFSLYSHAESLHYSQSLSNLSELEQPLNHSVSCIAKNHNVVIYRNLLITSLTVLLTEAIMIPTVNLLGRRLLFSGSVIVTSICVFCTPLANTSIGILVFSCIVGGISGAAWNMLNVWTSELYPTQLRSTSNGLINACGRVGVIFGVMMFGLLLQSGYKLPMIVTAVIGFISGVLSLFLPDTTNAEID